MHIKENKLYLSVCALLCGGIVSLNTSRNRAASHSWNKLNKVQIVVEHIKKLKTKINSHIIISCEYKTTSVSCIFPVYYKLGV